MDPAGATNFSGQPPSYAIEPINEFGLETGSISDHAGHVHTLNEFGVSGGLGWDLPPFDGFSFDGYQGFEPQAYQEGFIPDAGHALPGLLERILDEVEDLSPLSTQTSNETLATPDGQARRRSVRKRRIENGYPCSEPFCQEAFDTAGELTKHCFRKHTPESSWPFACQACGKRFYDKRDYGRHENVERKRASMRAIVRQPPPGSPVYTESNAQNINKSVSASRKESRAIEELDENVLRSDASSSQEFTRSNDEHMSAGDLLEAATADLKRFVNLGSNHITIKATISSHEGSMKFSVAHAINNNHLGTETTGPAPENRISSAAKSSPQPETSKPENTDEAAVFPNTSQPRPRPSLGSVGDRCHGVSPSSTHRDKSPGWKKAITVTFRSRPGFTRSSTHPPALRMVQVGC